MSLRDFMRMHKHACVASKSKNNCRGGTLNNQLVLKRSVVAVSMAIAAQTAMAQNAAAQSMEPAMQTVVVTGSNLKRTDKEGPAPVSVITSQDIINSGVASVSDLMKLVPSMGSDTNQDMTSGSGFAKGVATACCAAWVPPRPWFC